MITINNTNMSEVYVGQTKVVAIYIGNTKVFPSTPSITWYDDEFKSVVLAALNLSDNVTQETLSTITDDQFAIVSFKNNTNIKTIADLAKFTNVTTIPESCFSGCTSLGTDDNVEQGSTLIIPSNITILRQYAFLNCSGYKSLIMDHVVSSTEYTSISTVGTFSGMSNLEGIINLSNFRNISAWHEFDGWGRNGSGIKVVMPTEQDKFGVWFAGAKLISMADSEANLVDNVINIPVNYTKDFTYAFGANYGMGNNSYILDGAEYVNSIIGGDNSSTSCSSITFGESCKAITGPCLSDNENNYTIICKAVTPPVLGLGGMGFCTGVDVTNTTTDNIDTVVKASEAQYPFMYTSRIVAIYVPDEAVDLYKSDTQACINTGSEILDCVTTEGAVNCFGTSDPEASWPSYGGDYIVDSRIIGWSRFADKIKPMSDLT